MKLLKLQRTEGRTRKHGGDAEDLVRALELGRNDEHLGELRLEREGRHDVAKRSEVCTQGISKLPQAQKEERRTHCLRRRTPRGS